MSDFHASQPVSDFPYRVLKLALIPADRALLHRRIEARFQQMLAEGLLDEVKKLIDRGDLAADLPAIRAVGYRQVWQHLSGELDYESMVEQAVIATRQYAKRQLTWLRSEPDLERFTAEAGDVRQQVVTAVAEWLESTAGLVK